MATKLIKGQIKQWEEPIGVMNAKFVAAHSDVRQDLKWQDAILVIGDERVFTESEVKAYERDLIWSLSDPGRFTERHREEKVIGQPFEETVSQWVSRARAIVRLKHGLSDPA